MLIKIVVLIVIFLLQSRGASSQEARIPESHGQELCTRTLDRLLCTIVSALQNRDILQQKEARKREETRGAFRNRSPTSTPSC